MPNIHDLRETRASRLAEASTILAAAEAAGRDLTETESGRFDGLKAEVRALDGRIDRAEALAEMERRADAQPVGADLAREIRSYSLAAAITGALTGRLTGREAEIHQELTRGREARSGAGVHLAVPTEVLLGETRDGQTAGTSTAGGLLVPTMLAPLADRFRPALKVESLGATVLRGLSGNLDLPVLDSSGSATWVAENGDATRTAASFGKASMAPKTVAGEYRVSRRLMLQSGQAIDGILRGDLGQILAQALDFAAIAGPGTGNTPLGVLATPGVETVEASSFLGDTAADLIAALEVDDVTGTGAFLTSASLIALTRKIKDSHAHTYPIAELFHGKRVEATTQVPNNIGTGEDKSALIYGLWSELVIGYWSSVDLLVNPYHPDVASNGGILIHAFLDADVVVRRPKAFVFAEV